MTSVPPVFPRDLGRYQIYQELASGGMATVHVGRLSGAVGFARTVAIKRLHEQYVREPAFVAMFLDEARVAARIRHPNVVSTLDVVSRGGELFLVMDYVHGESLSRLLMESGARDLEVDPAIASAVVGGVLLGLHAAHEAKTDRGEPLRLVHRDVSPQNVMVGVDGVARIVDFGIAMAAARLQTTGVGQVKGKLSYMAPEQLALAPVDRRTDLFAAGLVLWELLSGRRLFWAQDPAARVRQVMEFKPGPISQVRQGLPPALDGVLLRALAPAPEDRFATAVDMAEALSAAVPPAHPLEVGRWVSELAAETLAERAALIAAVEAFSAANQVTVRSDAPPVQPNDTGGPDAAVRPNATRAGLLAVLVLALLGLLVVGLARSTPEPARAPSSRGSALLSTAGSSAPPAVSPGAEAPRASASSGVVPLASSARVRRGAGAPKAPRPAATRLNCDPPFVIVEGGLKRYKAECF